MTVGASGAVGSLYSSDLLLNLHSGGLASTLTPSSLKGLAQAWKLAVGLDGTKVQGSLLVTTSCLSWEITSATVGQHIGVVLLERIRLALLLAVIRLT